jgi:hypothetical protein
MIIVAKIIKALSLCCRSQANIGGAASAHRGCGI